MGSANIAAMAERLRERVERANPLLFPALRADATDRVLFGREEILGGRVFVRFSAPGSAFRGPRGEIPHCVIFDDAEDSVSFCIGYMDADAWRTVSECSRMSVEDAADEIGVALVNGALAGTQEVDFSGDGPGSKRVSGIKH